MNFTISSYTTVRNVVEMDYPFKEAILSTLPFVDEVVVLDSSDKEDGTRDVLTDIAREYPQVKVYHENIDWKAPNHGIFDGQTKALSRSKCTGDFLVQFDSDEIFHELDALKIRPMIVQQNYLQECPMLALPVIEYWGGEGKVRMDVNPWKWRISRNLPDITHGIPVYLRTSFNGLEYSKPGSDSCDPISVTTGQPIPFMNFMDDNISNLRMSSLQNQSLVPVYEQWFNHAIDQFPGVHHYSWVNISRKIKQYRMFWTNFWKSLYNLSKNERENPFFPGYLWSEVTDEMIETQATVLETQTNGHIFHNAWNGEFTPGIKVSRGHPSIIKPWIAKQIKK